MQLGLVGEDGLDRFAFGCELLFAPEQLGDQDSGEPGVQPVVCQYVALFENGG